MEKATRPRHRSRVFTFVFAIALIAAGLIVGHVVGTSRHHPCQRLGEAASFPLGTVAKVRCAPLYVTNADGTIRVMAAVSPMGSGAPLMWDSARREFTSPHGEAYDAAGRVLSGPTDRPMTSCASHRAGTEVVLDARASRTAPYCLES